MSAPDTLSALLRAQAARQGGREALVHARGPRLSYAELDRRVDELARGLIALGLLPGERVVLWAANVPDWIPLEFALARAGLVLVTANTALKQEEIGYLLRQSRAAAVLHTTRTGSNEASATLDALLGRADGTLGALRQRVWLPSVAGEAAPRGPSARGPLVSLDAVVERGASVSDAALAAREAAVRPGDVVNIQYTSGTTGLAKGVMLSHVNVLHSGRVLGSGLRTTPADRLAVIVPMFHCFGCVVCVLGAITSGATLCVLPQFEPGEALRLIEEERCTLVHGVPTMFGALLDHPERPRRDLSSLRAGLVAGAPCPPALMERIERELPCPGIAVTYGLTEASPAVAGTSPDGPRDERLFTIGRPVPDVAVEIVDPRSGQRLPDGQEGELWVRGPNVMSGYFDAPDATAAALTPDGWLRTGDLAIVGAGGCLRIVGRSKDIIIRGGENIAPAEIEALLREHPDVLDAAVVGVPNPHFGEEVAAVLVLRAGKELSPDSYTLLLRDRLAAFKVPKVWRAVPALPLTGSGKVQKFKLREMLAGEPRRP